MKEEDINLLRFNKYKQKERYRFHRHKEYVKLLTRKKRIMNRRNMSEETFDELYHKEWFTLKNHGKPYYAKNYHPKVYRRLYKERGRRIEMLIEDMSIRSIRMVSLNCLN